jgi:hypothetical protein
MRASPLKRLWQANYSPATKVAGVLLLAALPFVFIACLVIALENRIETAGVTQRCELQFAQSLGQEKIFTDLPDGVKAASPRVRGSCEDEDSGNVSIAEQEYVPSRVSREKILAHLENAAGTYGWTHIQTLPDGDLSPRGGWGPALCGEKIADGHTKRLYIHFDANHVRTQNTDFQLFISVVGDEQSPTCP